MANLNPFKNEEESIQLGDLTIENRLDRLELYGSLQITKDKAGLKLAKSLKEIIDATLLALQSEKLPDHISITGTDSVENPFK